MTSAFAAAVTAEVEERLRQIQGAVARTHERVGSGQCRIGIRVTAQGDVAAACWTAGPSRARCWPRPRRDLEVWRSERGSAPDLRVVLVGDDPASALYARRIVRAAEAVGSRARVVTLAAGASAPAVRDALQEASRDPAVDGIILQLPLPLGIAIADVIDALDPAKDLDGIHPFNAGLVSRRMGGFAPSCAEAAVSDPQALRGPARGSIGRRRRSQQRRRPAGWTAAHRGGRHGHGLPSPDATPRRAHPAVPMSSWWRPDRRASYVVMP